MAEIEGPWGPFFIGWLHGVRGLLTLRLTIGSNGDSADIPTLHGLKGEGRIHLIRVAGIGGGIGTFHRVTGAEIADRSPAPDGSAIGSSLMGTG